MPIEHVSSMKIVNGSAPAIDQYKRIANLSPRMKVNTKTADYTCLPEDSGAVFLAGGSGATTFTLPAVASTGWCAWFVNGVDQNMVIHSAAGGDVVWDNKINANGVEAVSAGHLIGAVCLVVCTGTLWLVFAWPNASAVMSEHT